MPNGDPSWGVKQYPLLEVFFGNISRVLNDFARRRNLSIEKYYHQSSSWHFKFRHPRGGHAYVSVSKKSDDDVNISGVWWFDDYEKYVRLLKFADKIDCSITNHKALFAKLDEMFYTIINWQKDDLKGNPNINYKGLWTRQRTKEELELEAEEYPIPKLD